MFFAESTVESSKNRHFFNGKYVLLLCFAKCTELFMNKTPFSAKKAQESMDFFKICPIIQNFTQCCANNLPLRVATPNLYLVYFCVFIGFLHHLWWTWPCASDIIDIPYGIQGITKHKINCKREVEGMPNK